MFEGFPETQVPQLSTGLDFTFTPKKAGELSVSSPQARMLRYVITAHVQPFPRILTSRSGSVFNFFGREERRPSRVRGKVAF